MKKILLVAAVAALLVPEAFAQQRGQRGFGQRGGQRRFGGAGQRGSGRPADPAASVIDTDKDGTLSAEELAKASANLKSLDKDGDGAISTDEIREAMRASMFGGGRGGSGGRGGGPGSPGSATLQRAGLKLGQAAPAVTIHDDKGGRVRLADFKGKHTVIVFGCLT